MLWKLSYFQVFPLWLGSIIISHSASVVHHDRGGFGFMVPVKSFVSEIKCNMFRFRDVWSLTSWAQDLLFSLWGCLVLLIRVFMSCKLQQMYQIVSLQLSNHIWVLMNVKLFSFLFWLVLSQMWRWSSGSAVQRSGDHRYIWSWLWVAHLIGSGDDGYLGSCSSV